MLDAVISSQHQSPLGALPRELRNMIYREYTLVDDGYFFDFESCKLRMSGGRRIDLELMYSCRLFADEMRGLALRINTITFSTLYSPELRARAGRWEYLYSTAFDRAYKFFLKAAHCLTDEMRLRLLNQTTPRPLGFHVSSVIGQKISNNDLHEFGNHYIRGEVPSLFKEELGWVLKLAMTDPNVKAALSEASSNHPRFKTDLSELISILDHPWKIPTEAELDHIARHTLALDEGATPWEREQGLMASIYWQVDDDDYLASFNAGKSMAKYRFSAASAAIHFLNSDCMRRSNNVNNVQRIILIEDHESVGNSECHIRGLVPFHHKNPSLQVERRVSLWRNLFLRGGLLPGEPWDWRSRVDSGPGELDAFECSAPVARWIVEASLADIIPSTFTLILDGDPTTDRSADVFRDAIHRDAAWQRAFLQQNKTSDRVYLHNPVPNFVHDGFPDLLKKLSEGRGAVRCNFDPGAPYSDTEVEAIMEAHRGLPVEDWNYRWMEGCGSFETCAPLPPFFQLLLDTNLPSLWSDLTPPPSMRSWLGDNPEEEHAKQKTGGHSFMDWPDRRGPTRPPMMAPRRYFSTDHSHWREFLGIW